MKRKKVTRKKNFFDKMIDSTEAIEDSLKFFVYYPKSIIPIVGCWMIYASVILYINYYFEWEGLSLGLRLAMGYLIYFTFSLVIGITALVSLEIVQQAETTGNVRLLKAYKDTFTKNLIKAMPILIIWALLWLFLAIIETLLSRASGKNKDKELSAKAAVQTLSGIDGSINLSTALIKALNKGLRMTVFIILPSIAWEDAGPLDSVKKGFKVIRAASSEFAASFVTTSLFTQAIIFPAALLMLAELETDISYPDSVWYLLLIYMAFAWSISFIAEQLNVAGLYMWYMTWEKESRIALSKGKKPKSLRRTKRPSYFDGKMDL